MRVVRCIQNGYRTPNMAGHEEFLTQEFSFYATECRRMAELANPPAAPPAAMAPTSLRWTERIGLIAPRHDQPPQRRLGFINQPVYR